MSNFTKIFILLVVSINSSVFFAGTESNNKINNADTLTVNALNDSLTNDNTTLYKSIILNRDSFRYYLNKPYNKASFKFKYDSFKEKMKDPWIGDILKEIFFR